MKSKQEKINKYSFGKLAGVRPAEVCYKLEQEGIAPLNMQNIIAREYAVGGEVARLMLAVLANQKFVTYNPKLCSISISFPFDEPEHVISVYINSLIDELNSARKLTLAQSFIIQSVSIGQGALLLHSKVLATFLEACAYPNIEFTLDVGDYRHLTQEKLDVLLRYGVNYLSFDISSFVKKTRWSTDVDSFLKTYKMCLNAGVDVNLNLLNSLGSECWEDFTNSLSLACELAASSISVLVAPRVNFTLSRIKDIERNTWRANEFLTRQGYQPYFIGGQKVSTKNKDNSGGRLKATNGKEVCANNGNTTLEQRLIEEQKTVTHTRGGVSGEKLASFADDKEAVDNYLYNISFCKPNKQNKFSVFSAKARSTIVGCGIGAQSTKVNTLNNQASVLVNTTDLSEYVFDINTVKRKKEQFF